MSAEHPGLHGPEDELDHLAGLFSLGGMTRRDFLRLSGVTAAGLVLHLGCDSPRDEAETAVDEVLDLPRPPAPVGDVTVGIVRKDGIGAAVNRAIELAGGLDEIQRGEKVLIKPNLTTGHKLQTRVTTHPEVLRAVIRAVKERTEAGNITVAEASSCFDPSTLAVAKAVGVYDVVLSEGVDFLAWEDGEYVEATSCCFKNINFRIGIPKSLTDSTFRHFINVPMLKNHDAVEKADAHYTCCIKNHVAVLSREQRVSGGGNGIHQENLGEKVAELNLAVPTCAMNVVDALTVILAGGPAAEVMQYADAGLILACKDRVACDSVGVAVLRHYASLMGVDRPYVDLPVWDQAQIVRARELNLGRGRDDIGISSDGVEEIDAILSKWREG